MKSFSQITFFYYKDLQKAYDFYENVMKFEVLQKQEHARIYRIGKSYFGAVDGEIGTVVKALDKSAVMLTVLVDDVYEWDAYLKENGVKVLREMRKGRVAESALYEDPGGYVIEIQRFLDPADQDEYERGVE